MTASNHPGLTHAKPVKREKVRKPVRRITAKQRKISKLEQPENAKVIARSEGYCEVAVHYFTDGVWTHSLRCHCEATQIHHMLGGWRVRGRGESALAEHKQHVCAQCHEDITSNKLQRLGGPVPLWTDCYERTR